MRGQTIDRSRLRALMAQADLRVNQLAQLIGCSASHLYHVFSGATSPAGKSVELGDVFVWRTVNVLSKALGRDVDISEFTTPVADDERAAS